jgi:hypothetical protein
MARGEETEEGNGMKITKICIFAYNSEGEALAVANNTVEATGIAEIRMIRGGVVPAKAPVAWIVLRDDVLNAIAPKWEGPPPLKIVEEYVDKDGARVSVLK